MKDIFFVKDENDENSRLDNYLSELYGSLSRSYIQNLIKGGNILVNEEIKKASYKVKFNDKIEFNEPQQEKIEILPEKVHLEIVYEDENMLVVNKPSGMLTHPTEQERSGTLVNALIYKFGENLSDINGFFRRGIVHRLDRNTSGLLMVAKNNKTHEFLAQQLKDRLVEKKYLAVVKGVIKQDNGILDFPIGRNPNHPEKMAVVEDAKPSITHFNVIQRFKDATYLELDLKTGRTHQIRVHLSHVRHPIVNDSLYGGSGFKVKTQEQVLQSYNLRFTKPFSSDIIQLKIEPDEKISKVLRYLESKS